MIFLSMYDSALNLQCYGAALFMDLDPHDAANMKWNFDPICTVRKHVDFSHEVVGWLLR